jgi:Flp pilus assembly protein TadB
MVMRIASAVCFVYAYFAWQRIRKMRQEPAWSDLRTINASLSAVQRFETWRTVGKGRAVVHPELADAAIARARYIQSLGRDHSRFIRDVLLMASLLFVVTLVTGLSFLLIWVNLVLAVLCLTAWLVWNLWFPRVMDRSKELARRAEDANRALLGRAHP